jgi:hypothetical protein
MDIFFIHHKPSHMTFHIEFEWQVDQAGYDWVEGKARQSQPRSEETIVDVVYSALLLPPPDHIVPRGGQLKSYRPLEAVPNLFRIFSKLATTPHGLLEFVNRYGPMLPNGNRAEGEDALTGLAAAQEMATILETYPRDPKRGLSYLGNGQGWSRIDVYLAFNSATARPYFVFKPPCLLNALWLELGQFVTGDAQVRECFLCGEWFETGPGTRRRADARFCSDQHRIDYNSLKRTPRSRT